MGKALFTNNATGTLASPIATTGALSLVLTAGQGALFPAPTGGNYFYATVVDASNNKEIVKVTANVADTFTIVRAQDGTTALTFASGSRVELRPVAAAMTEKVATGDINATILTALGSAPTGTGSIPLSASPTFTGTMNVAALTASGAVSAASLAASAGATVGTTLGVGTDLTVTGLAAVHTIIGGWSTIANFECLAGGGHAISAYQNGASANAFLARVDQTTSVFMDCRYSTTTVGSISTNGTTTSFNTSSDRRLKDNIVNAGDAGAIIDALQVRAWDWKMNGAHEEFGFVAQEEVLVAPFAVRTGDDDPTTITAQWGRDDSKLVPLLVKEIQSLRARLAAAGL